MRTLVFGGRGYPARRHLFDVLDALDPRPTVIIHGCCPTGADAFAEAWAQAHEVPIERHPANWRALGGARAGPARNEHMAARCSVERAVAFPGGRGTADMRRRCVAHGIPIIEGEVTAPTR